MKRIYNYICNIPRDKWIHLGVSAAIAVIFKNSLALADIPYEAYVAFLVTIDIGAFKEIYDKCTKKGSPEFKDFIFDVIGAVIGVL